MQSYDPAIADIFSTSKKHQHETSRSQYFLNSANKVCCFLEEHFEEGLSKGKEFGVNKIGHALHDKDDVFRRVSRAKKVKEVVKGLGYWQPLLIQSMYICKQALIGGKVDSHRDGTFIGTTGKECLGLWWALEDATKENGCLWVVPGSHTDGIGVRMVVEKEVGKRVTKFVGEEKKVYEDGVFREVPVKEGGLVLLHGGVVHMSKRNWSGKSRHAYSIHVVDSEPWAKYCEDNWLQRPDDDPFTEL